MNKKKCWFYYIFSDFMEPVSEIIFEDLLVITKFTSGSMKPYGFTRCLRNIYEGFKIFVPSNKKARKAYRVSG